MELSVSESNESLIPLLVSKNGTLLEGETYDDAVLRIVKERTTDLVRGDMIIARLQGYFGEAGQETVDSINTSLENGAFNISTNVESVI